MSKQRSVLGKGLSALIPGVREDEIKEQEAREQFARDHSNGDISQGAHTAQVQFSPSPREREGISKIAIARIAKNPQQPRKEFDPAALEELAKSIREHGIIQPVTVRKKADGNFELVSGERRVRASIEAGLSEIPAYVLDVESDRKMLELAIIENVQRAQFNPVEEAEAYQRLIEECDLTQEEVAEKIARDRSTITNFLRLLKLPEAIRESMRNGNLGMGHAKAVMTVPNAERQVMLWQEAVRGGYSVRRMEELCRNAAREYDASTINKGGRPSAPKAVERGEQVLHLVPLENSIKQTLGTQVKIRFKSKDSGEIAIEFYNQEDLERLSELLMTVHQE